MHLCKRKSLLIIFLSLISRYSVFAANVEVTQSQQPLVAVQEQQENNSIHMKLFERTFTPDAFLNELGIVDPELRQNFTQAYNKFKNAYKRISEINKEEQKQWSEWKRRLKDMLMQWCFHNLRSMRQSGDGRNDMWIATKNWLRNAEAWFSGEPDELKNLDDFEALKKIREIFFKNCESYDEERVKDQQELINAAEELCKIVEKSGKEVIVVNASLQLALNNEMEQASSRETETKDLKPFNVAMLSEEFADKCKCSVQEIRRAFEDELKRLVVQKKQEIVESKASIEKEIALETAKLYTFELADIKKINEDKEKIRAQEDQFCNNVEFEFNKILHLIETSPYLDSLRDCTALEAPIQQVLELTAPKLLMLLGAERSKKENEGYIAPVQKELSEVIQQPLEFMPAFREKCDQAVKEITKSLEASLKKRIKDESVRSKVLIEKLEEQKKQEDYMFTTLTPSTPDKLKQIRKKRLDGIDKEITSWHDLKEVLDFVKKSSFFNSCKPFEDSFSYVLEKSPESQKILKERRDSKLTPA